MIVKKFEAHSLDTALEMVREEFGPDAVVLKTKVNRRGFGLLSGKSIEVTAAISNEALDKKKFFEAKLPQDYRLKLPKKKVKGAIDKFYDHHLKKLHKKMERQEENLEAFSEAHSYSKASNRRNEESDEFETLELRPVDKFSMPNSHARSKSSSGFYGGANNNNTNNQSPQVDALKSQLIKLERELDTLKQEKETKVEWVSQSGLTSSYLQKMLSNDVPRSLATQVLSNAVKRIKYEDFNEDDLLEAFVTEIESLIKFVEMDSYKYHAFVGPSGSGKTSLAIKYASQLRSKGGTPLIVNGDNKIMASSFLKSVSKVIRIDCVDIAELGATLKSKTFSHIIFDCPAGKPSGFSDELIKALKEFNQNLNLGLVVGASTSTIDANGLINSFNAFKVNSLNITKIDEVMTAGNFLTLSMIAPLGFFGTGKQIPQDLEFSNVERLIALLVDI